MEIPFAVGGRDAIIARGALKYRDVILDTRLNFEAHIRRAAYKAATVNANQSRFMAKIGGPKSAKRRRLMATVHGILSEPFYGTEISADALRYDKYRKRMASVQRRGALRVTSAYRTVAKPAVLAIKGIVSIDLLACSSAHWLPGWRANRARSTTTLPNS